MQVNIPIPVFEEIPTGIYVIGGILAYYWITGIIIRTWIWPRSKMEANDSEPRFFMWVFSPVIIIIVVIVLTVWTLLSMLSGGLVQAPWKSWR